MPRLSLTWKIFLGTAAIVTVVLLATLIVTSRSARREADASIDRGLDATTARVAGLLDSRERALAEALRVFVQPSPFWGRFVPAPRREEMLDQAEVAVSQIGADWVQITDAHGVRLAKSDDPTAPSDTLSRSALIGGALEGRPVAGFGLSDDTLLYQAVSVPVVDPSGESSRVYGVVMATRAIESALADSIERATASDIVFYTIAVDGWPHVAASTLPRSAALDAFLANRIRADTSDAATTGSAGGGPVRRAEVELDGAHFVGQGGVLRSAGGAPLGGFVALRSREAELAGFMQLRRTIVIAGLLGLLLAFLLSWAIAHQITRPVAALVSATRKAADGDYSGDITVRSRDEIGMLADAFRAMLADLREKQALVDYLSSADEERTRPLRLSGAAEARVTAGAVGALLQPGQTLGNRYQIVEILGVGGMGMVYKAVDRELGETIAIKTLKPDMMTHDPQALERFKSEIRLARKISHRNVVRTHDLGETGGVYFITMEYVEGKSLRDLIRSRGRLPVGVTLSVAKQLCRALEVAHEQGVIHRDIKSQNIVVEPSGVLKVMDFGIARLAQRAAGAGMTQAGMVVGTPEYMAPEQLLGDEVDARVDIYAAGVVFYECLTGRLPFVADSPITLIAKLLEEEPTPVRDVNPEVPPPLAELVMRAMARNAAQRPPTAAALHDSLERLG